MNKGVLYSLVLYLICTSGLWAQSTFHNLDFESANVAPIPAGQYGGFVPITNALPYWTGYLGTNQVTQVLQNNATFGQASIDLYGPNFSPSSILQGQYTVVLQPGNDPFGTGSINVSLAQVGLVPANAKSIFLEASRPYLSVSFAGQPISLSPVGSGPNYTLYAGDITAFSGQGGELRISSTFPANNPYAGGGLVDAISFSTQPIPEPSALSLLLIGMVGLVFVRLACRRVV